MKVSESLDNVPNENVVTQQVTDQPVSGQLIELLEWLFATKNVKLTAHITMFYSIFVWHSEYISSSIPGKTLFLRRKRKVLILMFGLKNYSFYFWSEICRDEVEMRELGSPYHNDDENCYERTQASSSNWCFIMSSSLVVITIICFITGSYLAIRTKTNTDIICPTGC